MARRPCELLCSRELLRSDAPSSLSNKVSPVSPRATFSGDMRVCSLMLIGALSSSSSSSRPLSTSSPSAGSGTTASLKSRTWRGTPSTSTQCAVNQYTASGWRDVVPASFYIAIHTPHLLNKVSPVSPRATFSGELHVCSLMIICALSSSSSSL